MAGMYSYYSHVGLRAVSAAYSLIVAEEHPPYDYDGKRSSSSPMYPRTLTALLRLALYATNFCGVRDCHGHGQWIGRRDCQWNLL